MAKKPVSTNLDDELSARVHALAQIERRSISQIIEMCVERALVQLEAESSQKQARRDALVQGRKVGEEKLKITK